MNEQREFRFINGAKERALLIVEPKSSEFWVKQGAMIRVVVDGGFCPHQLEVEYLPNGLVVYTAAGSEVRVYENDRLLAQDKISRQMDARLSRP